MCKNWFDLNKLKKNSVLVKMRHLRMCTHMVQYVPSLLRLNVIVVFLKTGYDVF